MSDTSKLSSGGGLSEFIHRAGRGSSRLDSLSHRNQPAGSEPAQATADPKTPKGEVDDRIDGFWRQAGI